jgi:hypothetical protein
MLSDTGEVRGASGAVLGDQFPAIPWADTE